MRRAFALLAVVASLAGVGAFVGTATAGAPPVACGNCDGSGNAGCWGAATSSGGSDWTGSYAWVTSFSWCTDNSRNVSYVYNVSSYPYVSGAYSFAGSDGIIYGPSYQGQTAVIVTQGRFGWDYYLSPHRNYTAQTCIRVYYGGWSRC